MEWTRDTFNQIPAKEKVRLTFEEGQEIMARIYLYYTIKLFQLGPLFVEVWYRPHHNRIDKVEAVVLEEVIHLYEKEIDISDIFGS